ncbi:MAG: hypothetical protein IPN67_09590 [Bacteroidales bacterium]|nr:hypothetical protein [Bacteroidales bacterium]
MQIDRSNYEIWIIDWLDGNLNSLQVEKLKLFLEQNHDLREEFNDLTSVKPASSGTGFHHKENLKKSPSDLSPSQFEYLCAAYLENDLNASQESELMEIVNEYPDKKKTFDQIQKTRLYPERITYKNRGRLLKRTTFQKVIRLSVAALSTAAAISLVIIIYSVIPGSESSKSGNSSYNILPDSNLQRLSSQTVTDRNIKDNSIATAEKKSEKRVAGIKTDKNAIPGKDYGIAPSDDLKVRISDNHEIPINKITVNIQPDLRERNVSNSIIPSGLAINLPDALDERSHIGKFISKTFRDKFLKEKAEDDSPLRGYEIAEAGVTGLNKLLGWQMALDMKNDENGQPASVNFSSGILKFQAPVKKRDVQP